MVFIEKSLIEVTTNCPYFFLTDNSKKKKSQFCKVTLLKFLQFKFGQNFHISIQYLTVFHDELSWRSFFPPYVIIHFQLNEMVFHFFFFFVVDKRQIKKMKKEIYEIKDSKINKNKEANLLILTVQNCLWWRYNIVLCVNLLYHSICMVTVI